MNRRSWIDVQLDRWAQWYVRHGEAEGSFGSPIASIGRDATAPTGRHSDPVFDRVARDRDPIGAFIDRTLAEYPTGSYELMFVVTIGERLLCSSGGEMQYKLVPMQPSALARRVGISERTVRDKVQTIKTLLAHDIHRYRDSHRVDNRVPFAYECV